MSGQRFELKPMDRLFWAITLVCGLLVWLPAFSGRLGLAAGAALVLLLLVGWFRPIALEVDAEGLRLIYPMRWRSIGRGRIARAWRLDYRSLGPMVRVGVGGFMGNYGMFYRPGKGWVDVNVTSTRDLVLLELSGGYPLLLSPRDPQAFLASLGLAQEEKPFP